MEIKNWETTRHLNELYRQIRELGLEANVAELDNFGFTVVEPDRLAPRGFTDRLREAILRIAEEREGRAPDVVTGSTHVDLPRGTGDMIPWLLFEDRVFEEALMNPVALALTTYLLGESCRVSVFNAFLKGPGKVHTHLHNDSGAIGIPDPLAPYAQVANATWVLSDYTKQNGALCFVPGSHRWCRSPTMAEMTGFDSAVPLEAPAGSLVVFHGNLWHGAFPRTAPGLRIALASGCVRHYIQPFEDFREGVPAAILERNPPRFATLLGQKTFHGYRAEGPDYDKVIQTPRGLHD